MAVESGTVSHYYFVVVGKFVAFMSFSDIVCGSIFLLNNFPRRV